MAPILQEGIGNASSVHCFGRRQSAAVDDPREHVSLLVGGRPSDVVFTAGATETNNLALQGAVLGSPFDRPRILISAVEHASVCETARWLDEQRMAKLDVIPVTAGGYVDPHAVDTIIVTDVVLVSVMAANSETGVLNPVADISKRARAVGAQFHCDATQMAGRLPFDIERSGADLVSLSSHKICEPGGVGALVETRYSLRRRAGVREPEADSREAGEAVATAAARVGGATVRASVRPRRVASDPGPGPSKRRQATADPCVRIQSGIADAPPDWGRDAPESAKGDYIPN